MQWSVSELHLNAWFQQLLNARISFKHYFTGIWITRWTNEKTLCFSKRPPCLLFLSTGIYWKKLSKRDIQKGLGQKSIKIHSRQLSLWSNWKEREKTKKSVYKIFLNDAEQRLKKLSLLKIGKFGSEVSDKTLATSLVLNQDWFVINDI